MSFNIKNCSLPSNFHQSIVKYENIISNDDQSISIEEIQDLIFLYSKAMEYYDSKDNMSEYKKYKKKTDEVLINPKINKILDNSIEATKKKKEQSEEHSHWKDNQKNNLESDVFSEEYNKKVDQIYKIREKAIEISKNLVLELRERNTLLKRTFEEEIKRQNQDFHRQIEENIKNNNNISINDESIKDILFKRSSKKDELYKIQCPITERTKIIEEEKKVVLDRIENEMIEEIKEIEVSYKNELDNMNELGEEYDQIRVYIIESMNSEIENLKIQYEQKGSHECEKILLKYK